MFVKIMGSDGKSYSLYDLVASCIFHERNDAPGWWATIKADDGTLQQVLLEGSAYVLNEAGCTIDRFVLPQ